MTETSEDRFTVSQAMKTSQFWLLYLMAFMSVFQGYYTLNVYKALGYTEPILMDDAYLTQVGSVAAMMGAMRFAWSAAMDMDSTTFKQVYGTLLVVQAILGATIGFAVQGRTTYAIWICLMLFTEGGHFTLMPNALRLIYGQESASTIYGVVFTFTGVANLLMLVIVPSTFGQSYIKVYHLTAVFSVVALVLLLTCFKEERLSSAVFIKTDESQDECQKLETDNKTEQKGASVMPDRLVQILHPDGDQKSLNRNTATDDNYLVVK